MAKRVATSSQKWCDAKCRHLSVHLDWRRLPRRERRRPGLFIILSRDWNLPYSIRRMSLIYRNVVILRESHLQMVSLTCPGPIPPPLNRQYPFVTGPGQYRVCIPMVGPLVECANGSVCEYAAQSKAEFRGTFFGALLSEEPEIRFCLSLLHILIYETRFHTLYYYSPFEKLFLYQTVTIDSMKLVIAEQDRVSLIQT